MPCLYVLQPHKAANCMIEWTLPCNYRLRQYVCCPLSLRPPPHTSPKPLTRWLLRNDRWNGSFCLLDTARTLWRVSVRDHGSSSNDCCCGSQSQLMTSTMRLKKASVLLPVSLCPSVCQLNSGGHSLFWGTHLTVTVLPAKNACIHPSIRPYMRKYRHTTSHGPHVH